MVVSDTTRRHQRENSLANQAKLLASGVFVVGRNPYEYIEHDLRTINHYHDWEQCSVDIDFEEQLVTISTADGLSKTAVHNGDQGCTILPESRETVAFDPVPVEPDLDDPDEQSWPMGDAGAVNPDPDGVDAEALTRVLDNAVRSNPTHGIPPNTRALVVVHDGEIVGERYAEGFTKDTPHVSWSKGKSVTAALIGILVEEGHIDVDQPAPIPEWKDTPREAITVTDLLQMSSGLEFQRYGETDDVVPFTDDDHHYSVYHRVMDVYDFVTSRDLEHEPGTEWRYRNCDPLTLMRVVRDVAEETGRDFLSFPQRALYDRIGVRSMVHETDLYGNFITSGFNYGTARDWARFGLLHLWEGEWLGDQILPEWWVDHIATPAPANEEDEYGGQFWLNAGGELPEVPRDAFAARGMRGQVTMVVPSKDTVIVRMGHTPNYRQDNTLMREILDCIEE